MHFRSFPASEEACLILVGNASSAKAAMFFDIPVSRLSPHYLLWFAVNDGHQKPKKIVFPNLRCSDHLWGVHHGTCSEVGSHAAWHLAAKQDVPARAAHS